MYFSGLFRYFYSEVVYLKEMAEKPEIQVVFDTPTCGGRVSLKSAQRVTVRPYVWKFERSNNQGILYFDHNEVAHTCFSALGQPSLPDQ